jgi:hypothetical protein
LELAVIMARGSVVLRLPGRLLDIGLDPVIGAARERQRRRRRRIVLAAFLVGASAIATYGSFRGGGGGRTPAFHSVSLSQNSVGGVRFGLDKNQAVAALSSRFGKPTAQGVNRGCGARYTEVAWGDFTAEFRSNVFSGYRYQRDGYPWRVSGPAPKQRWSSVEPKLTTDGSITVGSTLAQLRAAYPTLRRTGADWWRAPNQLFFEDNALRDPVPPSSEIVEIKRGTCGDF